MVLGIEAGLYNAHLAACSADAAAQLNTVLALMAMRMEVDYTPPRYRDLYQLDFGHSVDLADGLWGRMPGGVPLFRWSLPQANREKPRGRFHVM